jgi:murein DD-endopeptidase MepM/ murein hydrolase activator NlpD
MRITRVALSFFSVGFLAGTFEQAAGLGDFQAGHRSSPVVATAFTAASFAPVEAPDTQSSRGAPLSLAPTARLPQTPEEPLGQLHLDGGDASAAEAVVAAFMRAPRQGGAETAPDVTGSLPLARRAFVSLPHLDAEALGVPDAQPAERPGAFSVRPPAGAQEFIMPIPKGRVTSMFHQGRYHPAIDLAAPLGTPVRATTRKQKVTFAGRRGGYGNLVVTRDPSGRQHYYGHLHRIIAGIGTLLEQGDLLGLLGSTGHSTGPHVHYEVRKSAGGHFNPATFLFPGLSVQRGYAWNDTRSPTVAAVRSMTKAAARINVKRTVHAARKVKRRVRVTKVARRARFAARAPTVRYYSTQRATRYSTRVAGRYAQPRPR